MYFPDRKYVRFHMFIFVFVALCMSLVNCSFKEQTTTRNCLEVASTVNRFLIDNDATKLDPQFLSKFADCLQHLQKLYTHKTTNWANIYKAIQEMGLSKKKIAPEMASKGLSFGGFILQLASGYVFHKTVELYVRAVKLESNSEFNRREFENLQSKKIQPLLQRIEKDIKPLLEKLDSATLEKRIENAVKDLDYHTKELQALSRTVRQDFCDARGNEGRSFAYAVGAASLCVASLLLDQPHLAVVPCGFAVTGVCFNIYNYQSFSDSGKKLQVLFEDVDLLCSEMDEYVTFLNQLSIKLLGDM